MKLHINIDQFNELNNKQKKELELWCFAHRYFTRLAVPGEPSRFTDTKTFTRYVLNPIELSIGQMVEFLEYHGKLGQILHLLTWTGATCAWRVTNEKGIPNQIDGLPDFKELCDALWEAVREKIKTLSKN